MLNFTFAYQPIVDVFTGRAASYEALVRGPANQSADSILSSIPRRRLHEFDTTARAQAIALGARLGITSQLNVNLLPGSLERVDVELQRTISVARLHGLAIPRLVVEVSEREFIDDPSRVRQQLAPFRALGGKIALDDFGTGHSGLSLLADLEPDMVKLDRILCREIDTDPRRQAIVRAILNCCRELRCEVVAEGIERIEELNWSANEGVSLFQGFLFGQPGFEQLLPVTAIPWHFSGDTLSHASLAPQRHRASA